MKNLAKFLLFVLLLSAGISLLYDYRLKHGGLKVPSGRAGKVHTCGRASGQSKTSRVARIIESGTACAGEQRRAIGRSGEDIDQARYSA
jgi:hypothetical protein